MSVDLLVKGGRAESGRRRREEEHEAMHATACNFLHRRSVPAVQNGISKSAVDLLLHSKNVRSTSFGPLALEPSAAYQP